MHKNISRFLSLALSLLLLIAIAGCSPAQSEPPAVVSPSASPQDGEVSPQALAQPEASPDILQESVTVVDQAGREVAIAGSVERIVSGYYISSSACIALGLADRLVGIEAKADSRPIYAMAAPQLLELPNVGSAKEFNLEGCIALEPDLVILPKRLKDSANTMAELGIPVILVSPENHKDLTDMLTLIGQAAGVEESALKLIAYYDDELAAIAELTKGIDKKPVVYMGGNSGYLTTAPKDMYQASLIETAGGVNGAAEVEGDNWTDISYEQLIAINPDVIVIPSEASYSKEDVLGDAQLKKISAIKEGRIYQMPKGFEAWDSPVPSCTLGIRFLLYALHEDIYPLETLQADAAAFYKMFYGTEIDSALIGK